jgi:signal transduction histidine kinase
LTTTSRWADIVVRMRSAIGSVRRWCAAHPRLCDTALAVVMVGAILSATRVGLYVQHRPITVLDVVLIASANLPLALRRQAPRTVLLACCCGSVAYAATGSWEPLNNFGCLFALYTLACRGPQRTSLSAALLVEGVLCYTAIAAGGRPAWPEIAFAALFCVVAWAPGDVRRVLADRNRQLAELTERLDRERAANARRAVVEERLRIARELHDVVAHHMSVISMQAGLARYVLRSDPPTAATALRTVADTAGQALTELTLLLTLLRIDPESPETPVSLGLDQLTDLVERVSHTVPVTLHTTGTPWPLTTGAQLCVYRVVQESLTNTVKHAAASRAEVTLSYTPTRLVVRTRDDGIGRTGSVFGHGLIGMKERATLYGGTLVTRAGPEGGFEIELTLPSSPASRAAT